MRLTIQRVSEAALLKSNEAIAKIGMGYLCFVAFNKTDKVKDVEFLSAKLLKIRLFTKEEKEWRNSISEGKYEIMVGLQQSIYDEIVDDEFVNNEGADTENALSLFNSFVSCLTSNYNKEAVKVIETDSDLDVSFNLYGPVTINLEYPEIYKPAKNLE